MEAKDTLFHINWGDGDTTFVIAKDKEDAQNKMGDGKDMVNYIVQLDRLYGLIFKAGIKEVAEWIEKDRYQVNQKNIPALGIIPLSLIHLERWQAKLRSWGL